MSWLKRLYFFFSKYVGPDERQVGRFFKRVSERDNSAKIERSLIKLLQHDTAVINLWTERNYKGYQYLTKRKRNQLYQNLDAIKADFEAFCQHSQVDAQSALEQVRSIGVDTSELPAVRDRLAYMATIMRYLSPKAGRYQYRESSSFGRLLRDPGSETLVGDCNQIVTLYVALYAMRFSVTDLKLTLLPGHVALHFYGIDVETTNGTFRHYQEDGQVTAPIHELVSVNLLDTTDSTYAKQEVAADIFLQAARLAYVVSGHRKLVERNLDAAYTNTVRQFMREKNYKPALEYAKQSKNFELIESAAQNGVAFATNQRDFSGARRFASASKKRTELTRQIDRSEAAHLFNKKNYEAARRLYQRIGESEMVKRCYQGLYSLEQAKLGKLKTASDVKAQAGVIRSMERYAKASEDTRLIKGVRSLTKHL